MISFDENRKLLDGQFSETKWIESSGLSLGELESGVAAIERSFDSKSIIKAKTFEAVLTKGRIAVCPFDIFQNHLLSGGIMEAQRKRWEDVVIERYLPKEAEEIHSAWTKFGAYNGMSDYGHTSPNSRLMLSEGFVGLIKRIERAEKSPELSEKQKSFYYSCKTAVNALVSVSKRFSEAVRPYSAENAEALASIAVGKPQNIYEAMQMLILYFFMHEYVGGTRVRTLGRLDVLLQPFYERDVREGRYSKAEIKEMLKFFLYKFWAAKVPYDLPFCLCGTDGDGNEVTGEITYLILETYNELNIHSPKIHIRVSEKTPESVIKYVLSCIRGGNSSFVFVNEAVGIESLKRVGITEKDARDFVPIGCYEPAVWGVEIGCTGNGGVNLVKAVELVFNNGIDNASGEQCGLKTGEIKDFNGFLDAVKRQIAHMTERATTYINKIERHYDKINPEPLLSSQYVHSIEKGVDVYEGGAKYNNSSIYFYCIASLVDSLCAVKKLVFEDGVYTFDGLGEMLRNNWQGHEAERRKAQKLKEKYGNGSPVADALAVEFARYCSEIINGKPNGRGGVYKAALFSIDHCFHVGSKTMATPNGRMAGAPLSKNMCATTGMDKNGITALINSVTKIDHADFPNGSVLDVVLHPSAVSGEEGLNAFYCILMTYMKKGGFGLHGNVFHADELKKAQRFPEKYKNLQVRVCGWNAFFVNLSRLSQDTFIKQAEETL